MSLLLFDCYGEAERRLAPMLGRLNGDGTHLRDPIRSAGAWFLYLGGLDREAVVNCLEDEGVAPYMMAEALGEGAVDEMFALLKDPHMADMDYFLDKFCETLRLPKQFFVAKR